mgnify:CR=1 FL=1
MKSLEQRFWEKVDIRDWDECWLWTAGTSGSGLRGYYGWFWTGHDQQYAHRIAYQLAYGDLSPELEVCHTCDNPPCCNPGHLFQGTHAENFIPSEVKRQAIELVKLGYPQGVVGKVLGIHQSTISKWGVLK